MRDRVRPEFANRTWNIFSIIDVFNATAGPSGFQGPTAQTPLIAKLRRPCS